MSKVGIYCRLSIEDKDKSEQLDSQSISNQKSMLRDYCIERGWEIYDIYVDDGYSGIDRTSLLCKFCGFYPAFFILSLAIFSIFFVIDCLSRSLPGAVKLLRTCNCSFIRIPPFLSWYESLGVLMSACGSVKDKLNLFLRFVSIWLAGKRETARQNNMKSKYKRTDFENLSFLLSEGLYAFSL